MRAVIRMVLFRGLREGKILSTFPAYGLRSRQRSALREQVPIIAPVEEQGLALVRLRFDHVAGQDQMVDAEDQVTEGAGHAQQPAREPWQLLATRPLDALPRVRRGSLGGDTPSQPVHARR